MANTKISALTALTGAGTDAAADLLAIVDTSTTTTKNITPTQLLIGMGVTSSAAELNILDGATLTVTELNYVDGVTSAIQTQIDSKQASDAQLTDIAGLTPTDNGVIIGNGTNFVVESGATLKTSLGLTIGTDVQAYNADLTDIAAQWTPASSSGAALLEFHEDTDNGTGKITLSGQASISVDKILYLPDATDTLVGKATTDTLTNKSIDLTNNTLAATKAQLNTAVSDGNVQFTDAIPCDFIIAASDETTALTTGTAKVTFRAPYAFTLTAVRASVTTAPTGGTLLTVDINESGTSILSTKLTFDASEKTTTTAATAAVISDSAIADDAEITIDIDAVGSTIAGAGLKVYLIGTRSV